LLLAPSHKKKGGRSTKESLKKGSRATKNLRGVCKEKSSFPTLLDLNKSKEGENRSQDSHESAAFVLEGKANRAPAGNQRNDPRTIRW